LGVKGILIKAAELGYVTQVTCRMPECFCPEELGGACYFEPVTDELTDWMPTHEHFPRSKREGGHRSLDNAIPCPPPLQQDRPFDIRGAAIRERSRESQKSSRGGRRELMLEQHHLNAAELAPSIDDGSRTLSPPA
jgi:hypothetical protein